MHNLTAYSPTDWRNIWISGRCRWTPPQAGVWLSQWGDPLWENWLASLIASGNSNSHLKMPCFTFNTLLFAFFLLFLSLVQDGGGLCGLLQLGHEALDVIKAVIQDRLKKRHTHFESCPDFTYKRMWLKAVTHSLPLLFRRRERRYQGRHWHRSLFWKRGEVSVHPFSFMTSQLLEFPSPFIPMSTPSCYPTPPYAHKLTMISLCSTKVSATNTSFCLSAWLLIIPNRYPELHFYLRSKGL